MKKIILIIISVLTLVVFMPIVNAKRDVKVYMFTKEGCTACEYAIEYFDGLLENEPDLFELVLMETFDGSWKVKNEELHNLLIKTLEHYGESTKPEDVATPIIIIGDYHQIGTGNIRDMYDRIVAFRDSEEEPIDRVNLIATENKIDVDKLKVDREALKEEEKAANTKDAIIIIIIFVVLIGGFAGLVLLGKKR